MDGWEALVWPDWVVGWRFLCYVDFFFPSVCVPDYTGLLTAADYSWWWTEELSETLRVSFYKQIWEISGSSWFYCKKFITMHGHMNVKQWKYFSIQCSPISESASLFEKFPGFARLPSWLRVTSTWRWVWCICGMILTGQNRSTWRKNDTDRAKQEYLEENLSQCKYVHHWSNMDLKSNMNLDSI
jgi:hypothetical protein